MFRSFAAGSAGLLLTVAATSALAEDGSSGMSWPEVVEVGDWKLRPLIDVRVRGEYRRSPVDLGGDVYEASALQLDGFRSAAPEVVERLPSVLHAYDLSERVRLGMGFEYKKFRGQVTLQDVRSLGWLPGSAAAVEAPGRGDIAPYEAWLDVRSSEAEPAVELRLGRQAVSWGEGRLLGVRAWWQGGATLDAVRLRAHLGAGRGAASPNSWGLTELEALAALLVPPGPVTPPRGANDATHSDGTGAQLYGLRNAWHLFPLLHVEALGLMRIARDPLPPELARGDTITADLRIFGDYRGVSYSAEGAYQRGRVASYGLNREVDAFAAAARLDWQTALPADVRVGLSGAYASGDDSGGRGESLRRFDPLLADVHRHHGMMDLVAWSNLIEGAGSLGARPFSGFDVGARYAFLGLAEPGDRWTTAGMLPVGADPTNTSHMLGHEVDVRVAYSPIRELTFDAGYGLLLTGEGARKILAATGRGAEELLHFGYLQAAFRVP
ncbi:MAG: alginate export family protein [Deltaproteobacteria bacterium]|nr:alginate export family protein [Deltaproteobacteria bacterium]